MAFFEKITKKLGMDGKIGAKVDAGLGTAFRTVSSAARTAGVAVRGAAETVAEKNRLLAQQNRLRAAIRREEKAAEMAYLALGRYYYHNLRDPENAVTEPYCADIDGAAQRIDEAVEQLEALRNPAPETAAPEAAEPTPETAAEPAETAETEPQPEPAEETAEPEAETASEPDASEELPYEN